VSPFRRKPSERPGSEGNPEAESARRRELETRKQDQPPTGQGKDGPAEPLDPSDSQGKEVAGIVVAAFGLLALIAIVVVALHELPDSGKSQNIVAIVSAAFGVIGAIVGAYFGIKTAKNAVSRARDTS